MYARFRRSAWREARRERSSGAADGSGPPVPPPLLRYRVHGALDRESFLRLGETCARNLDKILERHEVRLFGQRSILDFGCGCGRTLRFLADRPESCRLHGTDIDREAIDWCRRHLGSLAEWHVNGADPPLPFGDGAFDLAYSISVFTHIDEGPQRSWLQELARVVRPGGIVLLTLHGEHAAGVLDDGDRAALLERGFLFKVGQTGRWKLDGLPDSYQTAFHTRQHVEREWSRFFRIVEYVPRGITPRQDAVVMRRLPDSARSA